jgi:uncharacterized protein (DUF1697 family)
MAVVVSMLRGINVGGNNLIKMDALQAIYESLKLEEPRTYVQSGNIVFRTRERDLEALAKRIGGAIERSHGFCPGVILRSSAELRRVIAGNPFAGRSGLEAGKLIVTFLAVDPGAEGRDRIAAIQTGSEELRLEGRELYAYFPEGMGRSKVVPAIEKALKKAGTGRNWNTVTKLLEMAEAMEAEKTAY